MSEEFAKRLCPGFPPFLAARGISFSPMTIHKFKTQLESRVKKLLPADTPPRKMASQLRRRIRDPRIDYRLYKDAKDLYEEATPPKKPRTRKDKLKIVIWIVVALLSFGFMFYFFSQTSISFAQFGFP